MDDKDTNRLEAFSDGVFAVAITLLVLDIKPPVFNNHGISLNDAAMWFKFLDQWPMLLAFVTSFFTIGIMWLNHHRLFKHIERTNTGLLLLNLLLLFVIVFIPVPTTMLAETLSYPTSHTAAAIFISTYFAMACCFNILWRYAAYQGRLLGKDVDPLSVAAISRQYLFGPLLYSIGFGLVWLNVPVSILFSFALALFFALPGRTPRLAPSEAVAEPTVLK